MNGPDALAGVRRGVRPTLSDASMETPANADYETPAGAVPEMAAGADFPAAGNGASHGPGGPGRGGRPGRERPGSTAEHPVDRPARLSLSNWPVSTRLAAVFVVASVTGLVFGGLRVANAVRDANAYSRTAQLASLAQQATALAQAMENERDVYAGVAAYNTLAASATANKAGPAVTGPINAALARQNADLTAAEKATDVQARRTSPLASAVGSAFPASIQSRAADVSAMIGAMPGLRSELIGQPTSAVIANYSSAVASLFVFNDEITSGNSDAQIVDEVRGLGALSRAKDEASQERALVYSALLEASVNNAGTGKQTPYNTLGPHALTDAGGLSTLSTAQGLEVADLAAFDNAATPAQVNAYLATVAGHPDTNVQLIEDFISQTGDPRQTFEPVGGRAALGFSQPTVASTWYTNASIQLGQMRTIESQLVGAIVARSQFMQQQAMQSAVLTAIVTGGAVFLVLLVTVLVGRTLINPLRRLQADALEIAAVRLPARVSAAAAGTDAGEEPATVEPVGVHSTDEIGRVARAFDQVHAEAVRLAGNEAQLRGSLNAMFISLSRRSVPLIDRLARMIDAMEQNEDDPDQLANLFAMDHLVTRMRRNSENLLVLAGEEPVRKWTESVPLTDVTRAAAAEIEQYGRVTLSVQPGITVSGQVAADVVHLLAELIENATLFSPRDTKVSVTVTELRSGGVLIEVRDDGVGISEARLADMNWRLDHPPVLDVSISRHMGLYAVSRLAARHGIRVKLRPGTPQGLSALIWLPGGLARHDHTVSNGSHSRTPGSFAVDPVAVRPATLTRHAVGRHRSNLLGSSGEQPTIATRGETVRGEAVRGEHAARPAPAWFAAKRPSGGAAARSTEELAAGWRSTTNDWPTAAGQSMARQAASHDAGPAGRYQTGELSIIPEQGGQTTAGLPRRVPRTSAHPGSGAPDFGLSAHHDGTPAPVLGAPADGMAALQGAPYREPAYQDQALSRRRSPEAARSRLSGFQLGGREAVQAGPRAGQAPHAGEENSR
ncbi:MAG TPA: nitrate- and nitrite sensing domain-containing protein [Trebonia sp.]